MAFRSGAGCRFRSVKHKSLCLKCLPCGDERSAKFKTGTSDARLICQLWTAGISEKMLLCDLEEDYCLPVGADESRVSPVELFTKWGDPEHIKGCKKVRDGGGRRHSWPMKTNQTFVVHLSLTSAQRTRNKNVGREFAAFTVELYGCFSD